MDNRITGTKFISTRQKVNELYGSFDYDSWVMDIIKPEQGNAVLDLGCGTGKHVHMVSRLVGTDGTVVGVDKSLESIAIVRDLLSGRGELSSAELVECDLDETPHQQGGQRFDIILSSYAIYYSKDQVSLLVRLAQLLKPHGRLFVTGNDKGNNRELVNFINNLSPAVVAPDYKPFMTPQEIERAGLSYQGYAVYRKTNTITFPSHTEIAEYWRASSLYRPEIEGIFEDNLVKHFESSKVFTLTKAILGVLFYGR